MKNITIIRTIIALLTLILLVLFLTACGNPEPDKTQQPPVAVAIVLGNHTNSYTLNLSSPDLVSTVSKAVSDGFVSVINCDGQPGLESADLYIIPPQYQNADPAKLEADARQKAANILAGLVYVKAKTPELNTLAALQQAVRSFAAAPDGSQKIIYILDSGLSTTGQLDFRKNLLDADPDAIANKLADRNAVPDFTDITVYWQQLGDVGPKQPPLSLSQVQKLGDIWRAIIEQGGGTMEICNVPPGQSVNEASQYPPVSVVDLPPEDSISFEPEDILAEKETPLVFTERQVRFVGDTAKYVDPTAAEAALKPVADYMTANPDFKGLLAGTTASGNKDFCLKLSLERAEAVRDTLVSMGVPGENLITLGLGFDDPWHVADTDADGGLIEALASKNRTVVLMSADSDAAKEILSEK